MGLYGKIIDLQKLGQAWQKVKGNKPAVGVDDVTCDDFDANQKEELKALNLELVEHRYEVMPVKMVKLKKEDKIREVSLYTMRDKVVQASIATELNKLFDGELSSRAYAYRESMSALVAISDMEEMIQKGIFSAVCKTDVTNFFDNIPHTKLRVLLENELKEEDTVELIMAQLSAPMMSRDGSLLPKEVGIYQGASISPVLSNLYLTEFDNVFENDDCFYIRYADDIVALYRDKESAALGLNKMKGLLGDLGLQLNEEKTYIHDINEGFDFLGYHFDNMGKSILVKAESKLERSLEDVWLISIGSSLEERLLKGSQILNGWEQYYRGERKIANIYEYVVVVYMLRYKDQLSTVIPLRSEYNNHHKDIARYLIKVWTENNIPQNILLEYEQYFGIYTEDMAVEDERSLSEILDIFEQLMVFETVDKWTDLLQVYADTGRFNQCELISNHISELENKIKNYETSAENISDADEDLIISRETVQLVEEVFHGREDSYSREYINQDRQRRSEFVPEPLNAHVIKKHLDGELTVGAYLIRSNDTVHYLVIDIDVYKKILVEKGDESLEEYLRIAGDETLRIKNLLKDMGFKAYPEFSGYRGYHLWIFFSDWIALRYIFVLEEIIRNRAGDMAEGISLEFFPVQNRKKSGSSGQNIKIPLGIHLHTGKRSMLLDEGLNPVKDVNEYLRSLARYSAENIKRVIGSYVSDGNAVTAEPSKEIEIDYERLGVQDDSVLDVLNGCKLMQYLVSKAMTTGYLSHFERLSVLNVFGHLGEDGKDFVHTVMRFTINYKFHVTEMFIDRMPEKPISCVKLREQYKKITAEYGCNCAFRRTKNCYPSPVIHAIRGNDEENKDISVPISRTLTKTKKEEVLTELNHANKIEELVAKIVEYNKQKRGINKSIRKIEKELGIIFDSAGTDCMETDMGMLIRKRTDDGGYDWVIDI